MDTEREFPKIEVTLAWLDEPGLSVEHDDRGGVVVTADPRLSDHHVRLACAELPDEKLSRQIQSAWAQAVRLSLEAK